MIRRERRLCLRWPALNGPDVEAAAMLSTGPGHDDSLLRPLTSTVEHAHESRRTEVAFILEALQGERLHVHLRDQRIVDVTAVTARNGRGWYELVQNDGHVQLDPVGWVALNDIVAVVPVDPIRRDGRPA